MVDYGSAGTFEPTEGPDCAWVDDNGGTEAYLAPERLDGGSLLEYAYYGCSKYSRITRSILHLSVRRGFTIYTYYGYTGTLLPTSWGGCSSRLPNPNPNPNPITLTLTL